MKRVAVFPGWSALNDERQRLIVRAHTPNGKPLSLAEWHRYDFLQKIAEAVMDYTDMIVNYTPKPRRSKTHNPSNQRRGRR